MDRSRSDPRRAGAGSSGRKGPPARFYGQRLSYREVVAVTRSIDLRTTMPGPRSQEILERKRAVGAGPLGETFPIVVADARGATLTYVDATTFTDFTGGVGCLNVGHSHPKVVAAAQAQLEHFSHTDFTIVPYEPYVALAERLVSRVPIAGPAKAAFFNAG